MHLLSVSDLNAQELREVLSETSKIKNNPEKWKKTFKDKIESKFFTTCPYRQCKKWMQVKVTPRKITLSKRFSKEDKELLESQQYINEFFS